MRSVRGDDGRRSERARVPNYRCGQNFHVSRQREPVDAMVAAAVQTLSLIHISEPTRPY